MSKPCYKSLATAMTSHIRTGDRLSVVILATIDVAVRTYRSVRGGSEREALIRLLEVVGELVCASEEETRSDLH